MDSSLRPRSNRHSLSRTYVVCLLLGCFALTPWAQVSPPASDLPSDQQVIGFLTETIEWYRHRMLETQIAANPLDLVFLEDGRTVAAQIVQLSLDFARAEASLAANSSAGGQKSGAAAAAGTSSAELARLLEVQDKTELASRQASRQIEEIRNKLLAARGAERRKLQAALDATQSRLDVLQAGLTSLRDLVGFVQSEGRGGKDLPSRIEDLARTVPNSAGPASTAAPMPKADLDSTSRTRVSSILALSSEVSLLQRKLRILDNEISQTDQLRQSSQALRNPLLAYVNKYFAATASNDLQASDLPALQQQKAQFDALSVLVKGLAPAIVALDKQNVLLGAYTAHLRNWRAALARENEQAWKNLLLQVAGVAAVLAVLVILGSLGRRATRRHVQDPERRHIVLVIQRLVLWFMILLVVAFALASDWTSLATFFGLLTAGVAVALQSAILSAVGYFVLVGRRGIRVGDRVRISGVTGDVMDIGWLQFRLKEIDTATQQPTGNVVTFSNSFVLASPATGLSRFSRQDLEPVQLEAAAGAPQP